MDPAHRRDTQVWVLCERDGFDVLGSSVGVGWTVGALVVFQERATGDALADVFAFCAGRQAIGDDPFSYDQSPASRFDGFFGLFRVGEICDELATANAVR